MKKELLAIALSGAMCFGIGAASGIKINAELKQQLIAVNGQKATKQVVLHKGTTYVPLRDFGSMVGTSIDYKDGIIYVGGGDSSSSTNSTTNTTTYSRINPAPIGATQKITVKDYVNEYTAEICVKEVIRGNAAWTKIKEANMFNDEAPSGKEYILAKISVKAISVADDKKLDISGYDFDAYSTTNSKYEKYSVVEPDPELDSSLYSGASSEGYVAFLVDTSDTSPKVVYGQKYDGTGGVWFSLK